MAPIGWCRTCAICKRRYSRSNDTKRKFMSKFPGDEDRCRQWVKMIGNEDFAYIPIEKLHQVKYVCGDHFQPKDFNKKGSRLKKWAVPSLLINAPPLPDHLLAEFPYHIARSRSALLETDSATQKSIWSNISYRASQINSAPCTATKISAVEISPVGFDHNYCDLESQHMNQNYPAPESKPPVDEVRSNMEPLKKKQTAVEINSLRLDHNYCVLKFQDRNQDYSAPASKLTVDEVRSDITPQKKKQTSAVESNSVGLDHNYCVLQSQDRNQDYPGPVSKIPVDEVRSDMTPRKKKLLKKLQTRNIKLKNLQKKIHVIESIESPVLKTLITSTAKNQNRKHQARRWSNTDKGLALSIYKKSPKTYRFLRHILPLPSIRTLQTILQKITLEPGVNEILLTHLSKVAQNLKEEDKICVILFDEMALKKRLILNTAKDKIEGFEDLGEEGRTNRVANHALVFMMQGIRKKYKQPLAHYFVQGTISTEKLTVLLKNVIRKVTDQGFTVIATVCDQGPTNVGALNLLKRFSGNDAESNYFVLDEKKIYIIYDVPHLFKSIRNNFFQAGEVQLEHKKAKWRHLIQLEEKNKKTLHFTKITKRAVEPKFKGKMKVKLAAQILSNTVAAVLKLQAESSDELTKKELEESAEIIQDFDRLFDLTNGPASYKDVKKNLRENVKKTSFHHEKWRVFKNKLKTLKFLKNGQPLKNVRCVKGFLITLTSLQDIWHEVDKRGMKYLNLRQLNQDSLENLFGLIRQHSPTNKNPTCHHFTSALKSSIITRLSTPVSRGANCEQDNNNIYV